MNPEITFLRGKQTGIIYADLTGDRSQLIPVSDLPAQTGARAWLRAVLVKCLHCDTKAPAGDMHPAPLGLACSACHSRQAAPDPDAERRAAMEKAAKLLRLAQTDNPHEAALAAARAQDIIDRYRLSAAAVANAAEDRNPGQAPDDEEEIRDFRSDPLTEDAATWKALLAQCLADLNQCKAYAYAGAICIIGRASDVEIVRPFFERIAADVDRLAARHCRGNGRSYWNAFRLGAVDTIRQRLRAAQADTAAAVKAEALAAGGQSALVVVENSLARIERRKEAVAAWTKQHMQLRNVRRSTAGSSYAGREAGRRAGHSVNLGRSSGSLPSTRAALR